MTPIENKLTILYRIEPGCLGPDGDQHVDQFCTLANKQVADNSALLNHIVTWVIEPRWDKTLPEMQFKLIRKTISHDQAATYLKTIGHELDSLESTLIKSITAQVNQYLGY